MVARLAGPLCVRAAPWRASVLARRIAKPTPVPCPSCPPFCFEVCDLEDYPKPMDHIWLTPTSEEAWRGAVSPHWSVATDWRTWLEALAAICKTAKVALLDSPLPHWSLDRARND
jgi:hypothetical protein